MAAAHASGPSVLYAGATSGTHPGTSATRDPEYSCARSTRGWEDGRKGGKEGRKGEERGEERTEGRVGVRGQRVVVCRGGRWQRWLVMVAFGEWRRCKMTKSCVEVDKEPRGS
eukprot:491251-Rhodomonas_salina.1